MTNERYTCYLSFGEGSSYVIFCVSVVSEEKRVMLIRWSDCKMPMLLKAVQQRLSEWLKQHLEEVSRNRDGHPLEQAEEAR